MCIYIEIIIIILLFLMDPRIEWIWGVYWYRQYIKCRSLGTWWCQFKGRMKRKEWLGTVGIAKAGVRIMSCLFSGGKKEICWFGGRFWIPAKLILKQKHWSEPFTTLKHVCCIHWLCHISKCWDKMSVDLLSYYWDVICNRADMP